MIMLTLADNSAKSAQLQSGKQHNMAKLQTLDFQDSNTVMTSSRSGKKVSSSKTISTQANLKCKPFANANFADENENELMSKSISNQTKTSLLLNSHRKLIENENKMKKALKDIQRKSNYLKGSSSSNRVKPVNPQHHKSNDSLDSLKHQHRLHQQQQLCIDVKRVFNDELDSLKAGESDRSINLSLSKYNTTNDLTDLQIALIGLQFGDVVNFLYIKAKGQALIDMSNLNEAIEMIQYLHHTSDHSNLKSIEAAHSSYQQLTIDNNRAAATMNTIHLAKQIRESAMNGGDGCVIKALITNIVYPIVIDALYQVFSKCGNVLKIVLIQKNEYGALIQMKDEMQAQQAIASLNGRNMYNTYTGGCNILNLQVSRHKTIEVKMNNSKSWDYTNPLLPIVESRQANHMNNDSMMQSQTKIEHPLLPMPMNMAAAAAAAAAAAGHPFNSSSPYMPQNNQIGRAHV